MSNPHIPVLLNQILQIFADTQLNIFVDGTLGAGGHSAALLEAHSEIQTLIGIDQDPSALEIARNRLSPWKDKTLLLHGNFAQMKSLLAAKGIKKVDGILLDIGVSSMQFDQAEKGFSFTHDGPLDMRMDPKGPINAALIVNTWSEQDLGRIFRDFGEEKQWRAAARTIVAARSKQPILTTHELVAVLKPIFSWKKKGINPLTLIFQALRICVNREIEVLEAVLPQAIDLLNPGGRLAVISFHSLEDRVVKTLFRFSASDKEDTSGIAGMFIDKEPIVKIITRKPLEATEEEVEQNPRSRSAKLRAIEKL
jgi:16S rRNA (cytosine1402-N4)-methyltransferase